MDTCAETKHSTINIRLSHIQEEDYLDIETYEKIGL